MKIFLVSGGTWKRSEPEAPTSPWRPRRLAGSDNPSTGRFGAHTNLISDGAPTPCPTSACRPEISFRHPGTPATNREDEGRKWRRRRRPWMSRRRCAAQLQIAGRINIGTITKHIYDNLNLFLT